jgi:hypothetical protein
MICKMYKRVLQVRDMWCTLEEYIESHTKEEEIVESILQGALEKYRIDAAELDIKVPDLLLRQCEQEIQRVRARTTITLFLNLKVCFFFSKKVASIWWFCCLY